MLLFFLLFNYIICENCSERTIYYNENKTDNKGGYYFDPRTHIIFSSDKIDIDNYWNIINNTINCTGIWCKNGTWGDYEVGYIIPKLGNCSVDVLGNLIMVYKDWNQALDDGYYGERVKIYGINLVKFAYKSVYQSCYGFSPLSYPQQLCLVNNPLNYLPFLIGLFIVFIVIAITVYLVKKYLGSDENIVLKTY